MGSMEGRVAFITGASRGIGKAIAQRFSAEGAAVVLNASRMGAHGNLQTFYAETWEFTNGVSASFTPFGSGCAGSNGTPALAAQGGSLWLIRLSTLAGLTSRVIQWGNAGDQPVPGDYTGDGKTDIAVWQNSQPNEGIWLILTSESNYTVAEARQFGLNGDIPHGDRRGSAGSSRREHRCRHRFRR